MKIRPQVPGGPRLASLLALVLFISTGCVYPMIIRVADQKEVKAPELVSETREADFIFVGEVHNVRLHHRVQLEVIKALRDSGADVAIGLEMFRTQNQGVLDRWVRGEMDEKEFRAAYSKDWSIPWNQYKEIFVYARENSIPMVGLNIPRKITYQVLMKGFQSLTPEELARLPQGIECTVDKTYEKFIRDAFAGHEIEGVTFVNFCEAQMVWDNGMAHNAIEYMNANPGTKMVVLAGGGHSWKRGIPSQVSRLSDYSSAVVLPGSKSLELEKIGPGDADYVIAGRLF